MNQLRFIAADPMLTGILKEPRVPPQRFYGHQMGARKSYNPKNKGKKSYQSMLTFIAETQEYVWGELRSGGHPTGKPIYDHLQNAIAALPEGIQEISARADSGFFCAEAV